eukprot:3100338-Alexandrium_andersonii.AAC.1
MFARLIKGSQESAAWIAILSGSVFAEATLHQFGGWNEGGGEMFCSFCRCHARPTWGHLMWTRDRFGRE